MNNQQRTPSPFAAAFFGLVIGATVGALAVVFSNPDNRKKLKEGVSELDKNTRKQLSELQSMIIDAENQGRKKLAENLKTAAKQLEGPEN